MASNERDPDGVAGPAPRKRRAQDHAVVFGDDWEVPSAPQPKKTAAPPPPVPVPAPSGDHDTVKSAWLAGSYAPPPPSPPPKNLLSSPAGGHRIRCAPCGLGRARGRPHALGRPGRPAQAQFPNLGEGEYLVRKVERGASLARWSCIGTTTRPPRL